MTLDPELVEYLLATGAPLVLLPLTDYQADEVSAGLEADADEGAPAWGRIETRGKTRRVLIVDVERALYRLTLSREIVEDLAANSTDPADPAKVRSLTGLIFKIVDAAGGRDALLADHPTVGQWLP